eukprot:m.381925 g.381925  ORF g.381925 m.381925 type:complete len:65 (-) comp28252_c0_seq13:26-220(-)
MPTVDQQDVVHFHFRFVDFPLPSCFRGATIESPISDIPPHITVMSTGAQLQYHTFDYQQDIGSS